MFAALGDFVSGAPQEEEEEQEHTGEGSSQCSGSPGKYVPEETSKGSSMNFWSVASALRDSVKQRTAELAASIQETDWRKELGAFQQGLKEDSEELQHRTKEAVEHFPTVVEQLKSEKTTAALQAKAKEAQQQLHLAGKSLGNFGHKLMMGTTELFDQVKEAIQSEMAFDSRGGSRVASKRQLANAANPKFSRFEADVSAMQRDSSTYCDEPEDEEDFAAWLATFDLEARRPDVDALIASNTFMAELQARIVPVIVEYNAFWTRYFYRLHKLQQKHDQIIQLTQRTQEEEEVGWGSEDELEARSTTPRSETRAGPTMNAEEQGQAPTVVLTHGMPETDLDPFQQQEGQTPDDETAERSASLQDDGVVAPAGIAASTSKPQSDASTESPASEISGVSGGIPDRWTVVSSPRKEQHADQGSPPASTAEPTPQVETTSETKEFVKGTELIRNAGAVAAAAVAGAAKGKLAEAEPTLELESGGKDRQQQMEEDEAEEEESELSDFDVEVEGAEGDDAVDEDWGDDWE